MGHVAASQLEDLLSSQRVLQWFFTGGALAADESPLSPRLSTFGGEHAVAVLFELRQRGHSGVMCTSLQLVLSVRDCRGWRRALEIVLALSRATRHLPAAASYDNATLVSPRDHEGSQTNAAAIGWRCFVLLSENSTFLFFFTFDRGSPSSPMATRWSISFWLFLGSLSKRERAGCRALYIRKKIGSTMAKAKPLQGLI